MKKLLTIALVLAMATATFAVGVGPTLSPNAKLSSNSSVAKEALGTIFFSGGNGHVYVQAGSTIEDGEPLVAEGSTGTRFANAAVRTGGARVVGIAQNDIDTGNYAWVQISGVADVRVDTNTFTFGGQVLCGTNNVNSCISDGSDSSTSIGVALATDEDSAVLQPVLLNIR